jgi:Ca-activated chloride channel family protein
MKFLRRLAATLLLAAAFAAYLAVPAKAGADSGVLIPRDKTEPDPAILSLQEMQVDIRIDNGDARVWIRQIFTNHTQ